MRYYLDTNILLFLLSKQFDEIDDDVRSILEDYSTMVYVSNVAVQELVFLYRIGKFKYEHYKSEKDILSDIAKIDIRIVYVDRYQLESYASLQIADGHKDMNDHAIIAHAISDRIPLISSDREFHSYVSQGLDFVYNRR